MAFNVIFDPEVKAHLRSIEPKYHSLIHSTIQQQLEFEPEVQTRNRKPLRQPAAFGARWEIRFGPDNRFRVLYNVVSEKSEVYVLAIGIKERDRLFVAGEEIRL